MGSLFGGSGGTTTTYNVQNTAPWSGQQPYLSDMFAQAQSMYQNQQDWPQYFPSSTVAQLTPEQTNALGQIMQYGQAGGTTGLNAANNALTSMLNQGSSLTQPGMNLSNQTLAGMMTGQNPYMNYAGNMVNAGASALNPYLSGAYTNMTAPTYAASLSALQPYLSGQYVNAAGVPWGQTQGYLSNMIGGGTLNPWSSPGFENVVQNTLANTLPATTAGYVGGGRADSGLASRAAAQGTTSAIGQLANQYYTAQQQLQQNAANMALGSMQAQQGLQQNASQMGINAMLAQEQLQQGATGQAYQGASAADQLAAMQQSAAQQAAQNYLTQQGQTISAAQAAPSVDYATQSAMQMGYNAATQVQQQNQAILNDQINRWNYSATLPWNMLNQYASLVGGTGYGSSSSGATQSPYYTNTASSAGSLLSGLGSLGIASSLLFSDRELKTDIEKIGKSESGFPLYTFRYKNEPEGTMRIGLMAQDVVKKRPEAVVRLPFGLAVDYDKALAA